MSEYITAQEQQEYLAYKSEKDFFQNLEQGIQALDNICSAKLQRKVLVCGAMIAFDKGLSDFLNCMQSYTGNLILLSEVTAQYRRYTAEKIKFPFICTPHLLAKEIILQQMDISVTHEMKKLYCRKRYIRQAVHNLEKRHPALGKGYALAWSYYAYLYICKLMEKINPMKVILWNKYYAFHHIFCGICHEKNIPLLYMEFGCIPGTISIEEYGQQGESIPAQDDTWAEKCKVNGSELEKTHQILEYLKKSGLNRNIQPVNGINLNIFSNYVAGRKNILYTGQNDYESGMFPYTRNAKKYQSPVFKTTLEALSYLRLLAIKNEWNLIYKPHPLIEVIHTEEKELKNMDSVNIIKNANINALIDTMDLVVTILSQCAYVALIREKPVVMMGYTQLKGKGCVYEAYKKNEIEDEIKKGLELGYTSGQKAIFCKHVSQMLKYYLYDDNVDRELRFGRKLEEFSIK